MGYPTMFYLSDGNKELLKNVENKSELVNNLLNDYFKVARLKNLSNDELVKLREIKKARLELQNKLKELDNAN